MGARIPVHVIPRCKADIRKSTRSCFERICFAQAINKECKVMSRFVMSFNYIMFINPLALDSCRRALIILDRNNIFPPRQRSSNKQARPHPRWNSFKPLLTTVEKIFDFKGFRL